MSPDADRRPFATSVDGIDGYWPSAPEWLSFSSLSEAEDCPRRWALSRATYPSLWARNGYPVVPSIASLMGDVVHRTLEILVTAFASAGCLDPRSEDAVAVMKTLGGFSELLRQVTEDRLGALSDNPRAIDRVDHLRRRLNDRLPEMRRRTQSLVARTPLVAPADRIASYRNAHATDDSPVYPTDGTYAEMHLKSDFLHFAGRLDVVCLTGQDVHIIDYKTGDPDDHHSDQLQTYALLWAHQNNRDPQRPVATRLSIAYPGHDVDVKPLTGQHLADAVARLVKRIEIARLSVDSPDPAALPAADRCQHCAVRQLCDPYWDWLTSQPMVAGIGDLDLTITGRNGPRSWTFQSSKGRGLLRAPETLDFEVGARVRFVGVTRHEPDGDEPSDLIVVVNSSTELFELRV